MATTAEWLSISDLAEMLQVPLNTVYRWRYQGSGPVGHKMGRHVRFHKDDVDSWILNCRDGELSNG
jgi:excisionase family DNA binding protein